MNKFILFILYFAIAIYGSSLLYSFFGKQYSYTKKSVFYDAFITSMYVIACIMIVFACATPVSLIFSLNAPEARGDIMLIMLILAPFLFFGGKKLFKWCDKKNYPTINTD